MGDKKRAEQRENRQDPSRDKKAPGFWSTAGVSAEVAWEVLNPLAGPVAQSYLPPEPTVQATSERASADYTRGLHAQYAEHTQQEIARTNDRLSEPPQYTHDRDSPSREPAEEAGRELSKRDRSAHHDREKAGSGSERTEAKRTRETRAPGRERSRNRGRDR